MLGFKLINVSKMGPMGIYGIEFIVMPFGAAFPL